MTADVVLAVEARWEIRARLLWERRSGSQESRSFERTVSFSGETSRNGGWSREIQ